MLIAILVFLPVLIWNAEHDWASFRFQLVRATVVHPLSLLTVGDFLGLQFGLLGIIMLPVSMWAVFWPALLIVIGVYIVMGVQRGRYYRDWLNKRPWRNKNSHIDQQ